MFNQQQLRILAQAFLDMAEAATTIEGAALATFQVLPPRIDKDGFEIPQYNGPGTPAPPVTTTEGLDAENLPYDARIHTTTATKTQKGVWKIKPGVDKDLLAQVKAELRLKYPIGGSAIHQSEDTPPPPMPGTPVPPGPGPVSPAPGPLTPTENEVPTDFPKLMTYITDRQKTGTITPEQLTEVAKQLGMANIFALAAQPAAIPFFYAELQKL